MPLVPFVTTTSVASKPVTPSVNVKVKVTVPVPMTVPGTLSVMERIGEGKLSDGNAASYTNVPASFIDALTVN